MIKTRLLWADIAKVIAIYGVILLHSSAPFLVPFTESRQWWIGNTYDSLSRWCVPLFVMVSGALLLPEAEKTPLKRFLLVHMRRILVPLLVWSGVYFLYRIYVRGQALPLHGFFAMIADKPVYYHLWFVYMLVVLYLLAPAISAFLNHASEKHVWYIITIWFIWASLLPALDQLTELSVYFTPDMNDYSPLRLSGYFLLGYVLKDRRCRRISGYLILALAFLMGGAVTIFGTYLSSLGAGKFHPFFYKYFSINVVMMTVSLFLLVKSLFPARKEGGPDEKEELRHTSPRLLREISMSVFGVYLIHALVLDALRKGLFGFVIDQTRFLGVRLPAWGGIPFFAWTIFVFSLGPVLLIRRIPKLGRVFA
jgi:surface polysaccharide O-acyltransferase-like enzyme